MITGSHLAHYSHSINVSLCLNIGFSLILSVSDHFIFRYCGFPLDNSFTFSRFLGFVLEFLWTISPTTCLSIWLLLTYNKWNLFFSTEKRFQKASQNAIRSLNNWFSNSRYKPAVNGAHLPSGGGKQKALEFRIHSVFICSSSCQRLLENKKLKQDCQKRKFFKNPLILSHQSSRKEVFPRRRISFRVSFSLKTSRVVVFSEMFIERVIEDFQNERVNELKTFKKGEHPIPLSSEWFSSRLGNISENTCRRTHQRRNQQICDTDPTRGNLKQKLNSIIPEITENPEKSSQNYSRSPAAQNSSIARQNNQLQLHNRGFAYWLVHSYRLLTGNI